MNARFGSMGSMSHLVRSEPWGVTDLDLDKGHVFVRQDWRYQWVDNPPLPPWTHEERWDFHHRLDRLIWSHWSLKARLLVRSTRGAAQSHARPDDLASRFGEKGLTLSFDVRSVVGPAHWQAHVLKVDSERRPFPRSSTDFARRILELHSIDVLPHFASRTTLDPRKQSNVYVAPTSSDTRSGTRIRAGIPTSTRTTTRSWRTFTAS
jgi:hypothetical protein